MTFYDKYFFCSTGQHYIPHKDTQFNKGGHPYCPQHGKQLRLHAIKRGIHQ